MIHPLAFSWNWISYPIGLILFGVIFFEVRNQKLNSRIKPLKIEPKIFHAHNGALIAGLEIKNPNQGIDGFSASLVEIDPNPLPTSVYLRKIPFPAITGINGIIKSGQTIRLDVFWLLKRPEQMQVMFVAAYDNTGRIAGSWQVPAKDMVLAFEITANGVPMQLERFEVHFPQDEKEAAIIFKRCAKRGYKNTA